MAATTQLSPTPVQHFVDNNGNALSGGRLFTYIAGTSTPQATYTDSTGGTPNTNPIILNARGECNLWLTPGQGYKFVLQDASLNTIWTVDQVFTSQLTTDAITYLLAATGAVSRTLTSKLGDWVSVKDFGAKGDGSTNDAAAFQAAINWVNAQGGGCVLVPNGTYVIGSALTMLQKVSVWGESIFGTILKPTFSGNLFSIDLTYLTPVAGFPDASVGWANFTIDCVTQTGVTGIAMTQCRTSMIQNIKFKGCVTNVYIDRGRTHSLKGLYSEGTTTLKVGNFVLTSTDNADYVYESHLSDIHFFNNYTTGSQTNLILIRRGALILVNQVTLNDGWQGNVTASNGILLENDCQGCKVTDVVMAAVNVGVLLQPGAGPAIGPSFCSLTNIDIDQPRLNAVVLDKTVYITMYGCQLSSSGIITTLTAVVVRNGATNNTIIGCHIDGFNGVGGTCIDTTGCVGTKILDNVFTTTTNGVQIGASSTNIQVIGNTMSVPNAITGVPSQAGNSIKNNVGYKLTTNLAPALPASTVVTTNNTGYAVTACITGGTVTVISINGVFSGLTAGSFRLEPGDTIAVTYSVLPQWVWLPSWG